MSLDVIADFLTIIRNGVMAAKPTVVAPHSMMKYEMANILKHEGFIKDVVVLEEDAKKQIKIFLKYVDGESTIHEIKRKSTPGLRSYARSKTIRPVIGGLGLTILSTNQGIVTHKRAKELGIGGEVLCTVW